MRIFGLEITRAPKPTSGRRRFFRRGFDAAKIDRLTGDWPTVNRSADAELYSALATMRARSRYHANNDDYAKRFLQMCKTNIIGPRGVLMKCRARDDNGQLDVFANRLIETGWRDWGKVGVCTTDGRLSWIDSQNHFVDTVARDGESLVRMRAGYRGHPFGFAIEFIDPDYLDERLNENLQGGGQIRLGVEYNAAGQRVAYHFKEDYRATVWGDYGFTQRHNRVPADEILHAFVVGRIKQGRGIPWMAASLRRLKMLSGYEHAELVAARVGASKMGFFIESEEGTVGDGQEDEHTPIINAEPGTFESLPYGTEFQAWEPDHPVTAFEGFVLSILRGAASGLGVSYTSLANDLRAVSYSSIRQGAIEERDHWRTLQAWVIEHFCNVVFERWLEMALTTQAVPLPLGKLKKFNAPIWRPRGWQWVDPYKEIRANKDAVAAGFKSITDVVTENGNDINEIFEELEEEKKLAAEHGLILSSLPPDQGVENAESQPSAD